MVSDLRSDYARTCLQRPPHYRHDEMEEVFRELEANAEEWFSREGLQLKSRSTQRTASLRYQGQGFELTVPWLGQADEASTQACLQRFHALHRQLYTFAQEDAPVEIVTLGVTAVGTLERPRLPRLPRKTSVKEAIVGLQPVFFQDGLRDCPVYDRRQFGASAELVGPGIVIQLDATTLVGPGQRLQVDEVGSMIIDLAS